MSDITNNYPTQDDFFRDVTMPKKVTKIAKREFARPYKWTPFGAECMSETIDFFNEYFMSYCQKPTQKKEKINEGVTDMQTKVAQLQINPNNNPLSSKRGINNNANSTNVNCGPNNEPNCKKAKKQKVIAQHNM